VVSGAGGVRRRVTHASRGHDWRPVGIRPLLQPARDLAIGTYEDDAEVNTPSLPSAAPAGTIPDFAVAPLTVAWEITRACPLRCLHCRADAQHKRDPRELSTAEGLDVT